MVGAAFLWSIAGVFIKLIDLNPFALAGMRSFIAALSIYAYLKRPDFHLSLPQVAAAVTHCFTMLLFISANKNTTAANAVLLLYFAPVLAAFAGFVLLKERPHVEHFMAFPLVTAGMLIMFFDDLGTGRLFGNILALASAFTYSLYFVFMRMQKEGSPLESILLSHVLTVVVCLSVSIFLPMPVITAKSLGALVVMGTFQTGFASILFSFAIKRVSVIQASLIAVIEPVFNPVWVFFGVGEVPSTHALIGGGIILLVVTITSILNARRRE